MAMLIRIPEKDWDEVEALGAVRFQEMGLYEIEFQKDYHLYKRWLFDMYEEGHIILDHYYLAIGKWECYKCQKITSVVGACHDIRFSFADPSVFDVVTGDDFEIDIGMSGISSCNELVEADMIPYLTRKYGLRKDKGTLSNHCIHCDALQGDFYLFEEVGSPFVFQTVETASDLILLKVNLDYDIVISDISWDSTAECIRSYSTMKSFHKSEWIQKPETKEASYQSSTVANTGNRIDLKVPYAEKDEAKALGAKWDPTNKVWYVENETGMLDAFQRWLV